MDQVELIPHTMYKIRSPCNLITWDKAVRLNKPTLSRWKAAMWTRLWVEGLRVSLFLRQAIGKAKDSDPYITEVSEGK